jgi:hypothetical protein
MSLSRARLHGGATSADVDISSSQGHCLAVPAALDGPGAGRSVRYGAAPALLIVFVGGDVISPSATNGRAARSDPRWRRRPSQHCLGGRRRQCFAPSPGTRPPSAGQPKRAGGTCPGPRLCCRSRCRSVRDRSAGMSVCNPFARRWAGRWRSRPSCRRPTSAGATVSSATTRSLAARAARSRISCSAALCACLGSAAGVNADCLPWYSPELMLVAEGIDGASRSGSDLGPDATAAAVLGPAVDDVLWDAMRQAAADAGWRRVTVDALASAGNAQPPCFWSRMLGPCAEAIDALSVLD